MTFWPTVQPDHTRRFLYQQLYPPFWLYLMLYSIFHLNISQIWLDFLLVGQNFQHSTLLSCSTNYQVRTTIFNPLNARRMKWISQFFKDISVLSVFLAYNNISNVRTKYNVLRECSLFVRPLRVQQNHSQLVARHCTS